MAQQQHQQRQQAGSSGRSLRTASSPPEIRATYCLPVALAYVSRATLLFFQKSVHTNAEFRTWERCSAMCMFSQKRKQRESEARSCCARKRPLFGYGFESWLCSALIATGTQYCTHRGEIASKTLWGHLLPVLRNLFGVGLNSSCQLYLLQYLPLRAEM